MIRSFSRLSQLPVLNLERIRSDEAVLPKWKPNKRKSVLAMAGRDILPISYM
jgi:hypothetical protein